jgi:hypothetical protein
MGFFSIGDLYQINFSSVPNFVCFFCFQERGAEFCEEFFAAIEMLCILPFILLIWYITLILGKLNQSGISGINPTWS